MMLNILAMLPKSSLVFANSTDEKTKKVPTSLFSGRSDVATGAVSLSEINSIINRVIANSIVNFGRETIIIAPRYDDLNPDDRITA
jgi:hypothetical protein